MFAVSAWIAQSEGDKAGAEKLMQAAADSEDASVKHVQMENRLYPLREMYAELLLENGKAAEAARHFETSLRETPNRYRGLYGAALYIARSPDPKAAQAQADAVVDSIIRGLRAGTGPRS